MTTTRRAFMTTLAGLGLWGCTTSRPEHTITGSIVGGAHRRGHRIRDGFRPQVSHTERFDVAILGSGMAGLSAAWAFERAGLHDYVILELEDAPGGTSRSGESPISPYPWAAHYVTVPPAANRPLTALLEEIGALTGRDAAGRPLWAEDMLIREPEERVFFRGEWYEGLYPHVGSSAEESRQYREFEQAIVRWSTWRDDRGRRAFASPRALGSDDAEVRALDQQSVSEWLETRGWDSPRLRWFMEYACRDDFGSTLRQTSAWAGLHYFASRADPADESSGAFLTWPEGNGRLVQHLAQMAHARVRLGALVTEVAPRASSVQVTYHDASSGVTQGVEARHVVFALPRFMAAPLLTPYRDAPPAHLGETVYGAWMVANITLSEHPVGRGFELAWDNVLYDSDSLGYVVATHQKGRGHGPTVLTYYKPLLQDDVRAARTQLLETSWEDWVAQILSDLAPAHPEIAELVENVDVYLWGHAMVRPRPRFLWGEALAESARPLGRVHFAHTDLSGMALLEEAQYWGVRAAEGVMRARGHTFESWL